MDINKKLGEGNMLNAVLGSLDIHIAVIDSEGSIRYVNSAWKNFATENGLVEKNWYGYNYLSVCEKAAEASDEDAVSVLHGLRAVINGELSSFEHEYPCDSPTEARWYNFKVVPLHRIDNHFLISHQSVTKNKLILDRAERLSIEDPLTGLYNRRGLDLLVGEEFSRAKRDKQEVSFVVFDVDYFKLFNDYYGHLAGDQCLKDIAKVIKSYARRPGDIAARIGGDEFVLVLSRVSNPQAVIIVEAICNKIAEMRIFIRKNQYVLLSAGIATAVPESEKGYLQSMYSEADQALYAVKNKRVPPPSPRS